MEEGAKIICRKVSLYLSALDSTTFINKVGFLSILVSYINFHTLQTRMPVYLGHIPDDTSMKNFVHFGQMVASNRMQKYDHGYLKNYFKYGQVMIPNRGSCYMF